jgi:nitrogen fixation/metabolism regulation signal transduction histidine kinase
MVTPGVSGASPRRLRWIAVGQMVLWGAIGLGAFLLLAKSVQNSPEFSRLQLWILLFDICGVVALSVLLARKLWRLVRDYRAHVPGSRLTARTVAIFGALVIAPLLIVYLSSLEFINQGIDSWFKVEVKRGLSDAVDLSRAALELRTREYAARTQALAAALARASPAEVEAHLDGERRANSALEVVLFSAHARVIAASLENPLENLPSQPPADLVRQVEQHLPYISLEPQAGGRYLIRTAAALGGPGSRDERFVVATYPLPAQLAALSEAVQNSYSQYGDLAALREPLKSSFRLTLTLVLLLSMLAAIYGAIYSAQRLVRPVQDLIEGTRAVGKGDFGTRLPLPSRDEMGFIVHSFNDMTKRLRRARAEATQSQQAVERERERLAIILARLSTGVLALDRNMMVRAANAAAGAILGTDLSAATGRPLPELAATNERLGQFVAALELGFADV